MRSLAVRLASQRRAAKRQHVDSGRSDIFDNWSCSEGFIPWSTRILPLTFADNSSARWSTKKSSVRLQRIGCLSTQHDSQESDHSVSRHHGPRAQLECLAGSRIKGPHSGRLYSNLVSTYICVLRAATATRCSVSDVDCAIGERARVDRADLAAGSQVSVERTIESISQD